MAALPVWHDGKMGYGPSLTLAILLLFLLFAAPLGRIRRSANQKGAQASVLRGHGDGGRQRALFEQYPNTQGGKTPP